jgi:hypothetical protein
MRKYGVSSGKQFWMTVPRLLLALVIGFTIARPLELKIFEKEIDSKVASNMHRKILLNDSLTRAENKSRIEVAETERESLLARKTAIEDSLHRLQSAYIEEADGTGGSRKRGIESLTRMKLEAYQAASNAFGPELKSLGLQILYQDSILNKARSDEAGKQDRFEQELKTRVGFLERNKALSDLSSEEPSVFWANFFVSLLIILVETGPILSKLIMNAGPYEVELAKSELIQMAASENEIRKNKILVYEKAAELTRRQKETSAEMMEKITGLQKKNILEMMEKWDRGEADHTSRVPLNELLRKMKEQYDYKEEDLF